MKKLLLLSALLISGVFSSQQMQAQSSYQPFFEHVSLEAGWGLNIPGSPLGEYSSSDLMGVGSFYVGANYAFNETWGVRGTYAFNNFKHKDNNDLQFGVHKFMAEATLSLGNVFNGGNLPADFRKFDVIAHAGLGVSIGKRKMDKATDQIGSFQVGLMPTYKLSEKVSLNLDLTYVQNVSQASTFAGIYSDKTTGNYFTANIGISLALGK